MRKVELSAGTIEYEDTGGVGPVLVLLHGLAQNVSVWRSVVAELRPEHRCIVPTLPLGGHRRPMRTDADLSMRGLSRLVAEFLERLDLRGVTLVENDWGWAHLLISERARQAGRAVGPYLLRGVRQLPTGASGARRVARRKGARRPERHGPAATPASPAPAAVRLRVDEQASGARRGYGRVAQAAACRRIEQGYASMTTRRRGKAV
jgi:pimeloyl-ACP methyl ester carboxylesterase